MRIFDDMHAEIVPNVKNAIEVLNEILLIYCFIYVGIRSSMIINRQQSRLISEYDINFTEKIIIAINAESMILLYVSGKFSLPLETKIKYIKKIGKTIVYIVYESGENFIIGDQGK